MMGPPGLLGRKCDNKEGERHCAAETLLQEGSNARRAHEGCLMRDTFKSQESLLQTCEGVQFCTLWSISKRWKGNLYPPVQSRSQNCRVVNLFFPGICIYDTQRKEREASMVMCDIEGYPDNVFSLLTLIGLMTLPVQLMFYGMLPPSLFMMQLG